MENAKAIILAAGRGTRMASYSNMCPKTLLEFNNKPLLYRQLTSLSEAGINKFIIVGGYMIDKLEKFVDESEFDITLLCNPFYAVTNSIASLWFARKYLDNDVFITNADTYYYKNIYNIIWSNEGDFVFGIDEGKNNDMDYRVTMSKGEIIDMGKDIPVDASMAEYIGMALIRSGGVDLFKNLLEKVVINGNYNLWWEDLFIELMAKGQKISYSNVTGELWFEIDELRDYRRCQRYFSDKMESQK